MYGKQKMIDWKFANKLRPHNRNETLKHFVVKSIVFKILFNAGYIVYSEYDFERNGKTKVADILAYDGNNIHQEDLSVVVEIESKPTKKHNKDLEEFYKDRTLYIIDLREISDEINKMEEQIKHILGV